MCEKLASCSSREFCKYVNGHKDIFKNKVWIKRVHNTIKNNPNDNANYEELYLNTSILDRNMKAKQYREDKKNDEEFMEQIELQKISMVL